MHTIERNNKKSKKGEHLLRFMKGQLVLSVKSAKILCGYSENSGNDVILDKVSSANKISEITFNRKGDIVEKFYITIDGFEQIISNLVQKDKIQNAKLALELMYKAKKKIIDYYNAQLAKQESRIYPTFTEDEIVEEIKDLVGREYYTSKPRWRKLYDELDKNLDESIRHSHQRYKNDTGEQISILNYIKERTNLLSLVHDIALKLYNN